MTLNEILWRQICTIKSKSDDVVKAVSVLPDAATLKSAIATQTAIVVCYASYATGDVSPMEIYEDIIEQVSQLQSSVWSIHKTCEDSTLAAATRKLYESCATLKKRLRQRLRAITDESVQEAEKARENIINAFETTAAPALQLSFA